MRPLVSTKGILFLLVIIMILSLSQFLFPDLPGENNETDLLQETESPTATEKEILLQESLSMNANNHKLKNTTPALIEQKSKKPALPEEVFKELTDRQIINELIDYLDNFDVRSEEKKVEKKFKDGHEYIETLYQNGSQIKKSWVKDGGTAYVYHGLNGEKFVRNFYKSGSIREYMYVNPSENIINGAIFYETGELKYRRMKNDNGIIGLTFNKDGSIKEIINKGYFCQIKRLSFICNP